MPPAPKFDLEQREHRLISRRDLLKQYLVECVRIEDWHGVQDAASDLREVDAELSAVREIGGLG